MNRTSIGKIAKRPARSGRVASRRLWAAASHPDLVGAEEPTPRPQSDAALSPSPGAGDDLLGALVAERYRVEGLLAVGAACEVYRARHLYLDRAVALKALREPPPEDDRDRLLREARVLTGLRPPLVVRIYDYGVTAAGRPYLVTELLQGPTLAQLLALFQGALGLRRACRLGAQVAGSLAELHAHRLVLGAGLNARNLLIDDEERVRVLDVSSARAADADGRRGDGATLGKLIYALLTGDLLMAEDARGRLAGALAGEDRQHPAVAALEELVLRALASGEAQPSARHLEQVLHQVAGHYSV